MYNMHYFLFVYTKLLCACVYHTWEEPFIPGEVAVLQIFQTLLDFLTRFKIDYVE